MRKILFLLLLCLNTLPISAQKDVFNPVSTDVVQGLYKIIPPSHSIYSFVLFGSSTVTMMNDTYLGIVNYPFILTQKGNTTKFLIIGGIEYIYQETGDKVTLIPYETDGLQVMHLEKVK
jgi:hypothetical protein